jgi:uncharacterized membrane protein
VPRTTETAIFDLTRDEVFDYLADMSNLPEWDPSFEASERLDEGPIGEGARWRVVAKLFGRSYPMELTLTEYQRPDRVVFHGEGEGLRTTEDIRLESTPDGSQVTYESSYDSDQPALLDVAAKPAYVLMGKVAIDGLRRRLGS